METPPPTARSWPPAQTQSTRPLALSPASSVLLHTPSHPFLETHTTSSRKSAGLPRLCVFICVSTTSRQAGKDREVLGHLSGSLPCAAGNSPVEERPVRLPPWRDPALRHRCSGQEKRQCSHRPSSPALLPAPRHCKGLRHGSPAPWHLLAGAGWPGPLAYLSGA